MVLMSRLVCGNLFLGLLLWFQSLGPRFLGDVSWSSWIVFCATATSTLVDDSPHSPHLSKYMVLMRQASSGHSKISSYHCPARASFLLFDLILWIFLISAMLILYLTRRYISQRGVKLVLNFGWLQKRSNTPEIKGKYFPRMSSKGTPLGWKCSKGHTDWKKSFQRPELPIFRISVLTTCNSPFEQTSLVVPVSLCCFYLSAWEIICR